MSQFFPPALSPLPGSSGAPHLFPLWSDKQNPLTSTLRAPKIPIGPPKQHCAPPAHLLAHPFLLGRLLSALCSPALPVELMGLQRGGGQALGLDAPASWGGQTPTELPLIP